jgi:hypothetical protein
VALRAIAALMLSCTLSPAVALAQVNVAVMLGVVQFDAAGDDGYFTYGLQVRYFATPVVRIGFMGGTAHIGDPPLREWTLDGTDERMWRGAAFVELGTKPLHKASLSLRAFLGVNHSSGVIVQPTPPNSADWYGITDANTGVSYGGGAGLEAGPYWRLRVLAQANVWRDNKFGGTSFDPEVIFGIGFDL